MKTKYDYHQSFIAFVLLFIIMGFAYIVGEPAMRTASSTQQANSMNAIRGPHPDYDYTPSSTPELE